MWTIVDFREPNVGEYYLSLPEAQKKEPSLFPVTIPLTLLLTSALLSSVAAVLLGLTVFLVVS